MFGVFRAIVHSFIDYLSLFIFLTFLLNCCSICKMKMQEGLTGSSYEFSSIYDLIIMVGMKAKTECALLKLCGVISLCIVVWIMVIAVTVEHTMSLCFVQFISKERELDLLHQVKCFSGFMFIELMHICRNLVHFVLKSNLRISISLPISVLRFFNISKTL